MSYLRFQDVSKSFNGTPVVKSVSFSIEKGEVCGFVGRNGSGKTVVFELMTGLLVPDKGSVTFEGVNLTKKNRFFESLGVMIETPGFIPHYSGLKNLKILNSMSVNPVPTEEICALMTRLGLDPKNKHGVRTYSLGMRQKLGIIQAVMNKPELLVLDEPMNSLDTESVAEIRKLFTELNEQGATIVLASHIADDIDSLCTRKFRIDNSTIVEVENEILVN
ncbi:MAG: ABC transporter ATP-binding protein [Oscillospiraceae bacterium]|nr:ABC transporter ATP-binding protein [Oscillospiraceae bacterium]